MHQVSNVSEVIKVYIRIAQLVFLPMLLRLLKLKTKEKGASTTLSMTDVLFI